MMIFFVRRGEKTQKEYKESRFCLSKILLSLSVYVFLKPGSPPKRGRAHTRAHETGASVLFLSLLLGA